MKEITMDIELAHLVSDLLGHIHVVSGEYLEEQGGAFTPRQRELMEIAIGLSISDRYPLIDEPGN